MALLPMAVALAAVAVATLPIAMLLSPDASDTEPMAVAFEPDASAVLPTAIALTLLALDALPTAIELVPVAVPPPAKYCAYACDMPPNSIAPTASATALLLGLPRDFVNSEAATQAPRDSFQIVR